MEKTSKIFIAGDTNIIGFNLKHYLKRHGYKNVCSETQGKLNLESQIQVHRFFKKFNPDYVFLTSLLSGGIAANIKFPAQFLYTNVISQSYVIDCAYRYRSRKLFYFGSSCMYPADSRVPLREEALMTGCVEKTSEAYASAKMLGWKMCEAYRRQYGCNFVTVIPATVYGPNDHFDLQNSHVMASLILKFHEALLRGDREVCIWGTGRPKREFIYIDDLVEAVVFLASKNFNDDTFNIGTGIDISIKALANLIAKTAGFKGKIRFDHREPDGAMRKLLDNSKLKQLGWRPEYSLQKGIHKTYQWFKTHYSQGEAR